MREPIKRPESKTVRCDKCKKKVLRENMMNDGISCIDCFWTRFTFRRLPVIGNPAAGMWGGGEWYNGAGNPYIRNAVELGN